MKQCFRANVEPRHSLDQRMDKEDGDNESNSGYVDSILIQNRSRCRYRIDIDWTGPLCRPYRDMD